MRWSGGRSRCNRSSGKSKTRQKSRSARDLTILEPQTHLEDRRSFLRITLQSYHVSHPFPQSRSPPKSTSSRIETEWPFAIFVFARSHVCVMKRVVREACNLLARICRPPCFLGSRGAEMGSGRMSKVMRRVGCRLLIFDDEKKLEYR